MLAVREQQGNSNNEEDANAAQRDQPNAWEGDLVGELIFHMCCRERTSTLSTNLDTSETARIFGSHASSLLHMRSPRHHGWLLNLTGAVGAQQNPPTGCSACPKCAPGVV
jgi:hypothetical protein